MLRSKLHQWTNTLALYFHQRSLHIFNSGDKTAASTERQAQPPPRVADVGRELVDVGWPRPSRRTKPPKNGGGPDHPPGAAKARTRPPAPWELIGEHASHGANLAGEADRIEDFVPQADCPPMLDEFAQPEDAPRVAPAGPSAPPAPESGILTGHLLGGFCLSIDDTPIEKLPSGRSGALLKYLIYHHQRRIPREALMETFWPGAEPEMSRNRLNVAMSSIRHALRHASEMEIILFEDSRYFINPGLKVWLDVEELEVSRERARQSEARGKPAEAVQFHEAAANLYQGDFLEDDLYEEWTAPLRERLRLAFLDTLFRLSRYYFESRQYTACAGMCQSILERDNCREDVHCLLMRCYARQNQFYLALRQYHVCAEALRTELDVEPAAGTLALYEKLRRREVTQPVAQV